MSGQGRPHICPRSCRGAFIALLLGKILPMALALCAARAAADDVDVRLRLAWGGGESRAWQGTIQLSEGTLSEAMPLGLEADDPGSMQPLDAATLQVLPRTPRSYDGCDLRVQAPRQAKLIVHLWGGESPATKPLELVLERLIGSFVQIDLDEHGNRLLAQRSPGDGLRVKFARSSLVFATGETFELEVEPSELGLEPGAYLLAAALSPARSDDSIWNEDVELRVESGRAANAALRIPLPLAEGVFDVQLSLYQKRLTTPLLRGKPVITRKVQLVTIAPVQSVTPLAAWHSVLEFDPASPKWWERMTRLPSWTKLPHMPQHPVSSGATGTRTHLGRAWVELGPLGWQAYPLSISVPGTPHVLEVEYPSDIEQTLAISLIEPNAAGKIGPIGVDSGIDVAAPVPGQKGVVRRHRLVCWPQTRAPYVLLVNRRDDQPAVFGKINVSAGPAELPPLNIPQPNYSTRTLAAYYDKPLFAENFSGTEAVDPASGRNLDDWVTFFEGGQRLVQTLQHSGYNALVLTVACEGSAIYPSRLLEPTPKYDTGLFFESGQDAVRKDVLEMLLRLCDRSGIQLIPAVQFAAPLPELEAQRQPPDAAASGLEPIGPDGRTWLDRHGARRGMGVYYNPLDERVQRSMVAVVKELAERYAHHASFGGVAVQLGSESYALLPDETCSYDDATIARFATDTGTEMPRVGAAVAPGVVLASRAALLYGDAAPAWRKWRCEKMSELYKSMQREVIERRASAKLYLTTADLLSGQRLRLALRPTLPAKDDPAGLMAAMGLDVERLTTEGIVVPRPQRVVPGCYAAAQELEGHWNTHPALSELFKRDGRGTALHFLEPAPIRLADFDEVSPYGADKTKTLLISQLAPASAAQRQRFVCSLATLDAPLMIDGGWLLTLGQELALAPLAKVYRRLPSEPFTPARPAGATASSKDVLVRTLSKGGKTYFYALNLLPWPVTANITFQTPRPAALLSYSDERQTDVQQLGERMSWRVTMEPFDLVGGEVASADAAVVDWTVSPPAEASESLSKRIQEVRLRANTIRRQPLAAPIANASFEAAAADSPVPGWVTVRGPGIVAEVDRSQGYVSSSSLHLLSRPDMTGQAPIVWVRSEPIQPRATGRLRLVAFIRLADAAKQPRLRLAIEGKIDGQVYYRRANVGAPERAGDPPVTPLTATWAAYRFPLDDLPLSGLTDLRVGFDLMGEGEVWIDEVRAYDLWFEPQEHDELLWSIATADRQLSEGQLGDGQAFASSFWPNYLKRHVPLAEPRGAIADKRQQERPLTSTPAAAAGGAAAAPQEEPSRWDKLRGWMPSWPHWR